MTLTSLNTWFSQRSFVILALGFSSGLPLVLVASTLQAWYTTAGVNLMTIGILSLVGQPYIYKFLWAPLLDRYVPLPLGRRRSWILLMQIGLSISLLLMAFLNPQKTPILLACIAFIVACCSATQDTAINAYSTDLLTPYERGMGASMTTFGYRIAILVAGAFALILADHMGWRATYIIMAGLMSAGILVTLLAPRPQDEQPNLASLSQAVLAPLKEFLRREYVGAVIFFIVSYKLCDALALALNTTFLLRSVGFTLTELGAISKIAGLSAAIIGSLIGGALLPQLGLYRSLLYFGILQMLSNLPFALLAIVGKNYFLMAFTIFSESFCSSLSTVAFIVLLMSLCDKRYTATQYALFSALASIGRVFIGPLAALLVQQFGWVYFYVISTFVGIPSLIVLIWLRRHQFLLRELFSINNGYSSIKLT